MSRRPKKKGTIFPATDESAAKVFKHLEEYHGIDRHSASDYLHKLKGKTGRGGADNVLLDWTGNIYDPIGVDNPATRKCIGRLTDREVKRKKRQ